MTELLRVRNSERKSFLQCRQQWWWAYVEHWVANKVSAPLEFGTLIHNALELRYPPGLKRGPDPVLCWEATWMDFDGELYGIWTEDEFEDAYSLGLEMMHNYRELYGEDSQWEVIQPEMSFQVEVERKDESTFIMVGQIDAVVRDLKTDEIGLLEHKTIKGLPANFWFQMEEQPGTYMLFGPTFLRDLGVLPEGEPLAFTFYNFLSKNRKDDRPKNELGQSLNQNGTVSKRQPAPLFERQIVHRSEAELQALYDRILMQEQEMRLAREGKLAIYKNATSDCKWRCQFRDMCELHEMGEAGHYEEYRDAMFTKWDPYAAHVVALQEASR